MSLFSGDIYLVSGIHFLEPDSMFVLRGISVAAVGGVYLYPYAVTVGVRVTTTGKTGRRQASIVNISARIINIRTRTRVMASHSVHDRRP